VRSGNRSLPLLVASAAILVALLFSACGGGSGGGYGKRGGTETGDEGRTDAQAPPPPPPNAEEGTTFVSVASISGLGLVLVDSSGRTLYGFGADRGGSSSCYGRCAETWPPLLTDGEPHPSNGAAAAKLGTSERRDGAVQVTYAGHPLYTHAADKSPGEANGNARTAFNAPWFALKPNGQPAS